MQYMFRPVEQWPYPETKNRRGRYTFKAPWSNTIRLLERELHHLKATDLVIEAAFRQEDIRMDGLPRSKARVPWHPGIRLVFESVHGPLAYAADSCVWWEHNVRSVALGLEALRAVDRFGISRHGEQYAGWQNQLTTGRGEEPAMDEVEAARFLVRYAGVTQAGEIALHDREGLKRIYRFVARKLHPDSGDGSRAEWDRLQQAREVLKL